MEPLSPVNAFHVKRQAHRVSRMDTSIPSDRWNPFRHVWTDHKRSQTWDGNAAEAQTQTNPNIHDEDEAGGSPIEQTQTAPPATYRAFGEETANGRSSKDHDIEAFERTESSGDTAVPSQATADSTAMDGGAVLRKRKSERDAATPTTVQNEEKPKKEHRMFKHLEPREPFTFANQLQRTLLNSWINILLLAAPIGIVLGAVPGMNKYAIFVVNFIAIIPLAAMLSFATEEIALRVGETLGGLLNASFG